MKKRKITDLFLSFVTYGAAVIACSVLLFLVGYITIKGIPNLKISMFSFKYTSENVSVVPAAITTLLITIISPAISVPLGVFTAVYLVEYAGRGNKLVALIRIAAEALSGIPSIVYGLFGMLFFVTALKMGFSVISGSLTLSIMILPTIMRTTEEALLSVPDSYREAAFGLGAGRLRTVFKIILPSAIPGILAGVILSVGRIVGETAALIYTAGTVPQIPGGLTDSARTLAVHMYVISSEGINTDESYGAAFILMLTVIVINTAAARIAEKISFREDKD